MIKLFFPFWCTVLGLNTCIDLCNHNHKENIELSHRPLQKNFMCYSFMKEKKDKLDFLKMKNSFPFTNNLYNHSSVLHHYSFAFWTKSYKWKNKECNLLRLVFFTQDIVFEVYPGCCIYQQFIPSYYSIVIHCMDATRIIHHCGRTFALFPHFGKYECSLYKNWCVGFCVNIRFYFS